MISSPAALGYDPHAPSCPEEALVLWELYAHDPVRWIEDGCVQIQTQDEGGAPWEVLRLWPAQVEVVRALHEGRRTVMLKARQLGLTWLCAALLVHEAIFTPGSTGLIISLRETEAVKTLDRVRGIYRRLPRWMQARRLLKGEDGGTELMLSTGSQIIALPSHRGDSYTAKFVLIDEAALIPNLARLLGSIDPTVADSGRICLVSRANKADPQGHFATLARAAFRGTSVWRGLFLPWSARPGRDAAWYDTQRQNSLDVCGNLDQLHEQYPSTIEEALAPSSSTTRLPTHHVSAIGKALPHSPFLAHPLVRIYRPYDPEMHYALGVDVAEGVDGGDDSAVSVVCLETGEQVATSAGLLEPGAELPEVVRLLSEAYGNAPALIERNSIGVAAINALRGVVKLILGPDGKIGYQKNASSKASLWTDVASVVFATYKDLVAGVDVAPLIYDPLTLSQVALIQRETCKAPKGSHDDAADAWALAQWARIKTGRTTQMLPSCMTRRR